MLIFIPPFPLCALMTFWQDSVIFHSLSLIWKASFSAVKSQDSSSLWVELVGGQLGGELQVKERTALDLPLPLPCSRHKLVPHAGVIRRQRWKGKLLSPDWSETVLSLGRLTPRSFMSLVPEHCHHYMEGPL